jgi:hypothetical protein
LELSEGKEMKELFTMQQVATLHSNLLDVRINNFLPL